MPLTIMTTGFKLEYQIVMLGVPIRRLRRDH
ncbi:hypothetical protein F442_00560 [Phytophthora nicotianae P10297]|uniref:Uncharacterized protein n=3 Tax=Phytophthora nicotianae TaxID=4792 RepID=W2REY4_PHYN3|nr:hypothetical protein PPTG_20744 [Phytophthora nicotianae INRA-310]ETI57071.1 hypothetical protein F443_00574 [Phytophthora nicotianae P1569]ETN24008.1 hypothetical protein PPTG_20744 [Phytophthora nicotianae INRA-310]ETP54812.1 hypothetical protein F442_00560 [Phytophthora nicotianae P10297]